MCKSQSENSTLHNEGMPFGEAPDIGFLTQPAAGKEAVAAMEAIRNAANQPELAAQEVLDDDAEIVEDVGMLFGDAPADVNIQKNTPANNQAQEAINVSDVSMDEEYLVKSEREEIVHLQIEPIRNEDNPFDEVILWFM